VLSVLNHFPQDFGLPSAAQPAQAAQ
jgi:hypothetical protein